MASLPVAARAESVRGEAAEQPPVLRMVVICPAHHSDAVHRTTATAAVLDIRRQSGYLRFASYHLQLFEMPPHQITQVLPPRARVCVHLRTRCGGTYSNGLIPNHHRVTPLIPNRGGSGAPEWADLVFAFFIFIFVCFFAQVVYLACGGTQTDTEPQAQDNENPERLAEEARLLRARVQQLEADEVRRLRARVQQLEAGGTRLSYGSVATTERSNPEAQVSPPPYAVSDGRKVPAVES
ncbi:hypothetical protein B0H14DRAFT_2573211 [Mycena olivaceomarginata]|nr:hypothetical protein B0H14DRAFT_2573211 [Mycena olivaceomarginata]